MKTISAKELAEIVGGKLVAGKPEASITGGVSTDTRKISTGCVYIALKGERFDGDQFAEEALKGGASVVVVKEWKGGSVTDQQAVVEVADGLVALQVLAKWWRDQLDITVVGITGSNGKTSTKDFIASILSQKYQVSATVGNLNNHIGVPLTILATTEEQKVGVWEMGMNHAGEIRPLCQMAQPRFGVVTNIGTAHIEHLGSKDAIALEKAKLSEALPETGYLFLPSYSEYYHVLTQLTSARVIAVGESCGQVRAERIEVGDFGSRFLMVIEELGAATIELPVPGRHMVMNALLAAGVGWKLGLTLPQIAAGLAESSLTAGRLNRYQVDGIQVIDDTYNANPESMAAAIRTLSEMPIAEGGEKYVVLGRMGELGDTSAEMHEQTGILATRSGLHLLAVGEGAEMIGKGGGAEHIVDFEEAAKWLRKRVKSGDMVLFKGSRAATVEKIMNLAFPKP